MKQYFSSVGLAKLCRLFGKTRQAFYDQSWRHCDGQLQEGLIVERIRSIRTVIPGIGGSKLHLMLKEELNVHGIAIGRDRFFRLLREHNLLIKKRKRYVQTTWSDHPYKKWPDLTENIRVKAPEQLWVSDITYLRTESGFIYLSLITDAYSRKIVGYHLSQQLKAQGCLIALNKAIATLNTANKKYLIHHSDRGIQYCCEPYVLLLQSSNIRISMTQSGSPYDNAIAERVNGILKHQLGLGKVFKNYAIAIPAISHAIDAYNRLRPHMSCNNLTPAQAHKTTGPLIMKWKSKKL
jgi:transposase InsO family protein